MKKLSFVLAIFLAIFIVQSCTKDTNMVTEKSAPELPAIETFVMPFQDFSESRRNEVEDRTINNWSYSLGNILIWNSLLDMNLRIPVLSFVAAFNHTAEYQGNGIWLWAYEVTDDLGDTYQAELFGELLVSDEVKWDMYISKVGGFQNVHWYTGITANDESYAHWTLNFDPEDPKPFIKIDFEKDLSTGLGVIRYTNIIPSVPQNGGYIEYREGEGAATDGFDRAYDVYKSEIDNLLEINWDSQNKNGRVKDIERYHDTEWHCWGTDFKDIQC